MTCAACGKCSDCLKKCTACKSVRYCDVACQRAHRKAHRKECKKREKELKEQHAADKISGARDELKISGKEKGEETGAETEADNSRFAGLLAALDKERLKNAKTCGACQKTKNGLKQCNACKVVWYCDSSCQRSNRKDHKPICKFHERFLKLNTVEKERFIIQNREAVIGGIQDLPQEDCPICMVPLTGLPNESFYMPCCGKKICSSCLTENKKEEGKRNARYGKKQEYHCAFCREELPSSIEENVSMLKKRVELGDPNAMAALAETYKVGEGVGFVRNTEKAMELILRAVEMGHAEAPFLLAQWYRDGEILPQNRSKDNEYLKIAADRGDIGARYALGVNAYQDGDAATAIVHFQIAAAAGHESSYGEVQKSYIRGDGLINSTELLETARRFFGTRSENLSEGRQKDRSEREKVGDTGIVRII